MTTLVDLADMLNKLVEEVEHLDAQTYSDTLEGVEGAFELKAEKVVYAIRGIERRAALMKEQLSFFHRRIATVEENASYLKTYLVHSLEYSGKKALETPTFTIRLRKSTAVIIIQEEEIPTQMMRITEVLDPDKNAIKEQLLAGEDVPGAELERRTSLTITGGEDGEL